MSAKMILTSYFGDANPLPQFGLSVATSLDHLPIVALMHLKWRVCVLLKQWALEMLQIIAS